MTTYYSRLYFDFNGYFKEVTDAVTNDNDVLDKLLDDINTGKFTYSYVVRIPLGNNKYDGKMSGGPFKLNNTLYSDDVTYEPETGMQITSYQVYWRLFHNGLEIWDGNAQYWYGHPKTTPNFAHGTALIKLAKDLNAVKKLDGTVHQVKVKVSKYIMRGLTAGEKAMASKVFTGALAMNLDTVKMTNEPFPYQDIEKLPGTQVAMTPMGVIHWPKDQFDLDFSKPTNKSYSSAYLRHTFMHELGHVWQNRRDHGNLGVAVTALFGQVTSRICRGSAYHYNIAQKTIMREEKLFSMYGTEQQAEIIADYYFLKFEGTKPDAPNDTNAAYLHEYESKLANPLEGYGGVD